MREDTRKDGRMQYHEERLTIDYRKDTRDRNKWTNLVWVKEK
jgi:hypothetical protein